MHVRQRTRVRTRTKSRKTKTRKPLKILRTSTMSWLGWVDAESNEDSKLISGIRIDYDA